MATAPNAAVYGTEEIPIRRMAREGLVLNLIGVAIISTITFLLVSNGSAGSDETIELETFTAVSGSGG